VVLEACTVRRGQGSTTGRGKGGDGGGGEIRNQLSQQAVTSSVVIILDTYFILDTVQFIVLPSLRQLPVSGT